MERLTGRHPEKGGTSRDSATEDAVPAGCQCDRRCWCRLLTNVAHTDWSQNMLKNWLCHHCLCEIRRLKKMQSPTN